MKIVELTKGKRAIVDDGDWPAVSCFKWTALFKPPRKGSSAPGRWYAYRRDYSVKPAKTVYLHQVVFTPAPGFDIDHVDGDGLNCSRSNLRYATRSQNNANQKKRPGLSSRFKGVTWDKNLLLWKAQIHRSGKTFYLGSFLFEEDAAEAYNKKAIEISGEHARLNKL